MSTAVSKKTQIAEPQAESNSKHAGMLLQRKCACGSPTSSLTGSCPECGSRKRLQTKLSIGASNDPLEQEADRVADQVLEKSGNTPIAGSQLRIQRFNGTGESSRDTVPASVDRVVAGSGKPLDSALQQDMGERFGHDFSNVRVHSDAEAARSAREINSYAYTVGHDVVFGANQFAPETLEGRRLLAHELTHVVQQSGIQSPARLMLKRKSISGIDRIRDYLSYGLFDWKITDADAVAALTVLRGLPRIHQAEFISDRKYADRLRENLPPQRLAEFAQIEADARSALPPTDALDGIIEKLSYGLFDWAITDSEAVEALDILKTLSGEKLAVALNRIDYGRLMDNLPEERRQELIDLLAKALGTGGTTETSEKQDPGVALRSLRFVSDHGVLKDNQTDWSSSGTPYPEPEWSITPEGKEKSAPISHRKDSNISIELGLDVAPVTAPSAPIEIKGESDVDYLQFAFGGTANGGSGKSIQLTSTGKIPDRVDAIRNKYVRWKLRWGQRERDIGRSGPFTLFTTIGDPQVPAAATYKRMEKAVELVGSSPTLNSHEIVKTIMFQWSQFNLDVRYSNEWDLAGDMETGAQCIDLVRFVQSVISMVGAPGTAVAAVVWAQPATPLSAIESPWPHGGMSSGLIPGYPGQPNWRAVLLDGDMRPNNFEAALVFTDSGSTLYYPGGVASVLSNANEVLRVFNCLAWIQPIAGGQYEIMAVPASYRAGSCTVGARHSW